MYYADTGKSNSFNNLQYVFFMNENNSPDSIPARFFATLEKLIPEFSANPHDAFAHIHRFSYQ